MNLSQESKLPHIATTIFTHMSQLAHQHNALNLSQGFPDFACPAPLVELVSKHMQLGHNQYAPMAGIAPLLEAIAEKTARLYGVQVNPELEITVSSGATEALFAAISALIRPGDEAIIFDPAYDSYAPVIHLNGGKSVHIPLVRPDFSIPFTQLEDAICDKTRLIIINTPHNPSGSVLTKKDMQTLQKLLSNKRIYVIADEVYEHIIFDQYRHESVLLYPDLASRSFVISSFGKTYHTTGWKIGYCIAPPEMTREFRKLHQYLNFCTSTPMQYALAEFLRQDQHYLQLPDFYQKKRDLFQALVKPSRFKLLPCAGTYFQLLDYSDMSDQQDLQYAEFLCKEAGIAAIPISVFYQDQRDDKLLRFCFAKLTQSLERAGEILCKL